jgi:hypothetical protein
VGQLLAGAARAVVGVAAAGDGTRSGESWRGCWCRVNANAMQAHQMFLTKSHEKIQSWCQMPVDSEFEIIQMFPSQEPDAKLRSSSWLMSLTFQYILVLEVYLRRGQFLQEGLVGSSTTATSGRKGDGGKESWVAKLDLVVKNRYFLKLSAEDEKSNTNVKSLAAKEADISDLSVITSARTTGA